MKPLHRELGQIATKVEWTIRGRRKIKTRIISPFGLRRKNDCAIVECRQPLSFLHLEKPIKSEGLVSYKQAFVEELTNYKFTF
jgi:hypothetical protein